MHQTATIYGLVDRRDAALVMYVGQTRKTLVRRLCEHMHSKQLCARVAWIQRITSEGHPPAIIEIETVPRPEIDAAERKWISHWRRINKELLNIASGGANIPATEDLSEQRRFTALRCWAHYRSCNPCRSRKEGPRLKDGRFIAASMSEIQKELQKNPVYRANQKAAQLLCKNLPVEIEKQRAATILWWKKRRSKTA